jgi:hypothetical protein
VSALRPTRCGRRRAGAWRRARAGPPREQASVEGWRWRWCLRRRGRWAGCGRTRGGAAGAGRRRRRLSQEAGLRRMGSQYKDHLQTRLCTGRWSDRRRARWWASSRGRGRRRGRWEEGPTRIGGGLFTASTYIHITNTCNSTLPPRATPGKNNDTALGHEHTGSPP